MTPRPKCVVCGAPAPYFTELYDAAEILKPGSKHPTLFMCSEHQSTFVKMIRSDLFRMRLQLEED